MTCPHCSSSIPYNATTCPQCGRDVPLTGRGGLRFGDYWSGVVFAIMGLVIGLCGLVAVFGAVASRLKAQGPVTALILGVIGAGMCVFGWWLVRGGIRVIRGRAPSPPQAQHRA